MRSALGRVIVASAWITGATGCPLSDDYVLDVRGAGGVGTDGAGPGGADACASLSPPEGGECPRECTGGCVDGACTIACSKEVRCSAQIIACPAGRPCVVSCVGARACKRSTVLCPEGYDCAIACKENLACDGARFQCGATGRCVLTCEDERACTPSQLDCAGGDCGAACASQP